MQKTFNFFYAFLLAILGFGATLMAEDITLTTYYPAPYGAYEELTVTGNVGIGTTSPAGNLDVVNAGVLGIRVHGAENAALRVQNDALGGDFLDIQPTTSGIDFQVNDINVLRLSDTSGNVGIGTTGPNYKLDVAGDINTTGEVRKNGAAYTNPDYVFEPGYSLMSIKDLKDYVFENKHLPNLPSTDEIKKDGVKLFEQNRLLLEKLEEAYLHIFKLEERLSKLELIVQKER